MSMTIYQSESETINWLMSNNGTCGTFGTYSFDVFITIWIFTRDIIKDIQ